MSFLLMFMGTALIYPQSRAKGLFEIYLFEQLCVRFFCGEGEKRHFESCNPFHKLSFYQAYIDFLAILDYKTPIRAGSLCLT